MRHEKLTLYRYSSSYFFFVILQQICIKVTTFDMQSIYRVVAFTVFYFLEPSFFFTSPPDPFFASATISPLAIASSRAFFAAIFSFNAFASFSCIFIIFSTISNMKTSAKRFATILKTLLLFSLNDLLLWLHLCQHVWQQHEHGQSHADFLASCWIRSLYVSLCPGWLDELQLVTCSRNVSTFVCKTAYFRYNPHRFEID